MDEISLIAAARTGDVEAFNALILAYQDLAYSVAYRIVGDPDAAADATQEAFIAAFRKLYQFRGDSFKSWLMRIVTNACYDELRRRRRRPAVSLEALHEPREDSSAELHLHATQENPEAQVQRNELNALIERCLRALPDDQRVIAVLSDVEGYAYQDIAAIVDLPLGTVKSRLSRARARLRDCLRPVKELISVPERPMYD